MEFQMINSTYLLDGTEGNWVLSKVKGDTKTWIMSYDYIWEALAEIDNGLWGQPTDDPETRTRLDALHELLCEA